MCTHVPSLDVSDGCEMLVKISSHHYFEIPQIHCGWETEDINKKGTITVHCTQPLSDLENAGFCTFSFPHTSKESNVLVECKISKNLLPCV